MPKFKLTASAIAIAMAMNVQASDDIVMGETVVVSANRSEQLLLESPSSVSVVSSKQIQKSNATSVPDILKDEVGVRLLSDGTPGVKRVALRGESPNRTLIMVDGQRIDDQKNKSGAPLLINPFFIDRVEVVRGPASVLYGSDAAGGIVNVITKEASTKPFSAEAGLLYDSSANGFTEHATVSGTVQDFHYVFSGFNTNHDDIYLDGHKALPNTGYDAHGFNAALSYDLNDVFTVGYRGEYYNLDAETSTTTDDPIFSVYRAHIPEWKREKHALFLKGTNINELIAGFEASIYYQKNDKDFKSWPQRGLIVDVINEQETYGANVQFELDLNDSMSLVTGYDGRYEKLASQSHVDVLTPGFHGQFYIQDDGYKQYNHALYALLNSSLTDELTLSTGLRYNYVKNECGSSSMENKLSFPGRPPIPPFTDYYNNPDKVEVKTLGSVGLVYRPFKYGAFRASWSQGFRAPSIQELYLLTSTGTLQEGNPDLKPETSDNYEVGFRWSDPSGLTADIALFYTDSDDYIETASKNDGRTFTYRNIAQAQSYGIESELSYSILGGRYEPYLAFTAMERKYETPVGSTFDTGTPKFSGIAGLRFNGQLFDVDGFARFASGTEISNIAGTSYFESNEWGGYTTWNLKVSTDFGTHDMVNVVASLENIFDKHYQTTELIHEPGRFATVSVVARF